MKVIQKLIFLYTFLFCLWNGIAFAENELENIPLLSDSFLSDLNSKTENKTVLEYGKLEGQVFVPEGVDPTTVLIQVSGVVNFNSTAEDFYTYADSSGHFIFENTFTTGSSLILFFSDTLGILNKRSLLVNISKNPGIYTVYLERISVTNALSESFESPQNITKAGLCGKITGLNAFETVGTELYLQDSKEQIVFSAKYFNDNNLPDSQQNFLLENGNFCFFNVESTDDSFLYSLKLKFNDGYFKTFSVYLPFDTFVTNAEFDAKSELFRPIQFYSWNPGDKQSNDLIQWNPVQNVTFSTSSDYSPIVSDSNKDAVYFPLGDEFLNINYSLKEESQPQFFIFQPRNSLFTKDLLHSIEDFSPGQIYVDKYDPISIKILDPKSISNNNLNKLNNPNAGSVFLTIDTSDFHFDNKKINVYLKNTAGEDISSFSPLTNVENKKEFSGFFFNIPEGLYQVFVTVPTPDSNCDNCTTFNSNEKLLWSGIVESLTGKTQVLTNISDNKIIIENKLSEQEKNGVFISKQENRNSSEIAVEIIPYEFNYGESIYKQIMPAIPDFDYLKTHSMFYNVEEQKLCSVPPKEQKLFAGIVPVISIVKIDKQNLVFKEVKYQFKDELQFNQRKNSEEQQIPAHVRRITELLAA